jgi:PST family polysaccharide transporter
MFGGFARLQGDAARMRAAYLKGQQTLVFVLLPLGFGLSSIADRLVPFLMGPNWDAAVMVISWLAPVVALQVLYMPLLSFSMAVGRPRLLVVREAVNLACRLAGAWWFGLAGAVIARTAGAFLVILLTLRIARQFMDISVFRQIVNIWRSLVSVAAMLAVVTALKWALAPRGDVFAQALELLLFVSMGGLAYVATHFLLWLVAGRPDGAETFVITMIRRTARREL